MSNGIKIAQLRKARRMTQEHLASEIGTTQASISRLEKGTQNATYDTFVAVAQALGVSVSDLFEKDRKRVAVAGRVGAGAEITPFDDFAKGDGLYKVFLPMDLSGDSVVAVEVYGDSMSPVYEDGDVLFYSRKTDGVDEGAIGRKSIVCGADGRMWVKVLKRGTAPGLFHLISANTLAENQHDVRVSWAAPVRLAIPADMVDR